MFDKLDVTYSVLLILLRRSLFGCDNQIGDLQFDWDEVFSAAMEHSVSTLAFDGTKGLKEAESISSQLKKKLDITTYTYFNYNETLLRVQDECIECLNKAKIDSVVIKGSSAAILYSKPHLRVMGDIDILVSPEQFEVAGNVLKDNGFIPEKTEVPHHCHSSFVKDGCIVELHFYVNGIPENQTGEIIKTAYNDFFNSSVECHLDNHCFRSLSKDLCGLTFLLHIYEHLCKTGLGLRQLCDWATYINTGVNESFIELLKENGLYVLAKVFSKICVKYLGVDENTCKWCLDADDKLCDEVFFDILDSGNFGRRKGNNFRGSNLIISHDNSKDNILTNYKEIAYSSWPICYKYKFLLLLSPFVIFFRYLFRVITGKRDKVNIVKMMKKAKKRKGIYDKFDIFKK